CFVKYPVTLVNYLNVLRRANFSVCVGRRAVTGDARERNTIKVLVRGGHICGKSVIAGNRSLHHGIMAVFMEVRHLRVLGRFPLFATAYWFFFHLAQWN